MNSFAIVPRAPEALAPSYFVLCRAPRVREIGYNVAERVRLSSWGDAFSLPSPRLCGRRARDILRGQSREIDVATAQELLPGRWQGSVALNGMPVFYQTDISPTGLFATTIQSASGTINVTGTWQILNGNTLTFINTDYAPRFQIMPGPFGQPVSVPINMPAQEMNYFRFLDTNTLQMQSSVPGIPATVFYRQATPALYDPFQFNDRDR